MKIYNTAAEVCKDIKYLSSSGRVEVSVASAEPSQDAQLKAPS